MQASRSVASNPIVRFLADALRFYMEFHGRYDGFYGAFIHDPLAVAAALDPPRHDRGRDGRRRARRDADDRRDRHRLARRLGPAAERRRRGRGATPTTFLDRFVERVGRLAADRADVAR